MAKYKIEINSVDNIRELLQEIYKTSDEQLVQSQNEITKLASSTDLKDEIMDAKAKYAKAISDYMMIRDKAISKKIDIAKLLNDIVMHNGDVKAAIGEEYEKKQLNLDEIKSLITKNITKTDKKEKIILK